MKRTKIIWIAIALIVVGVIGVMTVTSKPYNGPAASGKLQIVAAENFWGSIVSQIGGDNVHVTNVVSDPNADPHEYESSTTTARNFAHANYVVLNGAGYDSWGDKLLQAQPAEGRKVLKVADLVGKKDGDNPHFWYNPAFVDQFAARVTADLTELDPAHADSYRQNLTTLNKQLAKIQNVIGSIKLFYTNTKIAATEDIFDYTAVATGLDIISPPAFTQAVAESNDPPTDTIATFQKQLQAHEPAVLIYNKQAATPLTESLKKLASEHNIPVIGITETLQPAQATYQDWMRGQLEALSSALSQGGL